MFGSRNNVSYVFCWTLLKLVKYYKNPFQCVGLVQQPFNTDFSSVCWVSLRTL